MALTIQRLLIEYLEALANESWVQDYYGRPNPVEYEIELALVEMLSLNSGSKFDDLLMTQTYRHFLALIDAPPLGRAA